MRASFLKKSRSRCLLKNIHQCKNEGEAMKLRNDKYKYWENMKFHM
ncbi:hypothetical protein HMPREF0880_01875 [Yokenella regensburgei ATCC 43003]|nr:hypothetical protein HMPREF0880_01875 [Yokenella regensburgei ATCC 43003]